MDRMFTRFIGLLLDKIKVMQLCNKKVMKDTHGMVHRRHWNIAEGIRISQIMITNLAMMSKRWIW